MRERFFGDPALDYNFTKEMRDEWVSDRDWRSVLAVPVLEPPQWIPVAVVTVTSNMETPFWNRFGEHQEKFKQELTGWTRGTASQLLGEFASSAGFPLR